MYGCKIALRKVAGAWDLESRQNEICTNCHKVIK